MDGNILLVDDNEDFIDSIKDILEDEGYHVCTANSGEKALDVSEQEAFDVVLMDIKMPGMNGVECFLEMKQRKPDVRVVMFTAYALTELIQQARDEGVCDVLKKPLSMLELVDTIEKVKSGNTNKYILLADDDAAMCDNLYEALTDNGYRVAVAGDGQNAVNEAKTKHFDVMLLDMKMPKLNGLEVYREVKKEQPDIITILMTGYIEEMKNLIQQGLKENVYASLTKPFEIKDLVSLLKSVFNEKRK